MKGLIYMSDDLIRYHCPRDYKITDINNCFECEHSGSCDVYSIMLDEQKEEK